MRLETDTMLPGRPRIQHDEFDVYFARAALEEEMGKEAEANRRGSLPNTPALLIVQPDHTPRRVASCKYPSHSRRKAGSASPNDPSRSPRRSGAPETLIETSPTTDNAPGYVISPLALPQQNNECEAQAESVSAAAAKSGAQGSTSLLAPSSIPQEFKCHSAPHSRSSSWKKMRRPRSNRDLKELEGVARERSDSIPFEETISSKLEQLRSLQADDCYVVRNFSYTHKGLINRGDSFKRKSVSAASDAGSIGSDLECAGTKALSVTSQGSNASSAGSAVFNVVVAGYHGVGKTALVQQFMTSEYMGALETHHDVGAEQTVSVLLDGEETTMDFYDLRQNEDYKDHADADAFVLVYSITDRISYVTMLEMLEEIREHNKRHPAVIVVANKTDLVRSRQVTEEEGKAICQESDCKYIETSAVLNHRVDDLLVGVVTQIRLHPKRIEKQLWKKRQSLAAAEEPDMAGVSCVKSAKGLIQKFFKRDKYVSKSCDNLLVL